MRVVMLCNTAYPRSNGGVEGYVYRLGRALEGLGHEVVAACPTRSAALAFDESAGGLRTHWFRFPELLAREEFAYESPPRHFAEFADWLAAFAPDAVHAHEVSQAGSFHHLALARALGARTVQTLHMAGTTCLRPVPGLRRWGAEQCDGELRSIRCSACLLHARAVPSPAAWAIAAAEYLALRVVPGLEHAVGSRGAMPRVVERRRSLLHSIAEQCDRIAVVAEWQRAVLAANGLPERLVERVPHAARRPRGPRRLPGERTVFGWAGRNIPEKGLEEVVAAFLAVREPRAELRIACIVSGRGDAERRRALAERASHDPRVVWVEPFAAEDVESFYGAIDVFVAPYSLVEAGPLTVVESLAHGVPVIGYALGGTRELVRDGVNGRLVACGDRPALERAMRQALDSATRRAWAAASRWDRDYDDLARDYLRMYADGAERLPVSGPAVGERGGQLA